MTECPDPITLRWRHQSRPPLPNSGSRALLNFDFNGEVNDASHSPSSHQGSPMSTWALRRRDSHRTWSPIQSASKNTHCASPQTIHPNTRYPSCCPIFSILAIGRAKPSQGEEGAASSSEIPRAGRPQIHERGRVAVVVESVLYVHLSCSSHGVILIQDLGSSEDDDFPIEDVSGDWSIYANW